MDDVHVLLREMVEQAAALHAQERSIVYESVLLVGRLDRCNAAVNLGLTAEAFAKRIGLSLDQYLKRCQAARVIAFFPEAGRMLARGETKVSHLVILSAKITPANAGLLLPGIKGKARREVERLAACVTPDGRLLDEAEAEIELKVRLKLSELALLDRLREVLAANARVPTTREIMVQALADLLERRDPMRKAERARERRRRQEAETTGEAVVPAQESAAAPAPPAARHDARRRTVPAAVRHAVYLRDESRCTWIYPDGSRCAERGMLELDHEELWCRGGKQTVDNLSLRCRHHNACRAAGMLGSAFMAARRVPRRWREAPP